MRFKATVWKTGDSKVLTIPVKLEANKGDEFWVTLEPIQHDEE